MRKTIVLVAVLLVVAAGFPTLTALIRSEPWEPVQLMEPAELADKINSSDANKPLIISIGPAATIKTSVAIGPGSEKENLDKLAQLVSREPKTRQLVIYCGCCPFNHCPNIRPAFTKLNELGFKNHKLLNLTKNLKTDWIDRGYPVIE